MDIIYIVQKWKTHKCNNYIRCCQENKSCMKVTIVILEYGFKIYNQNFGNMLLFWSWYSLNMRIKYSGNECISTHLLFPICRDEHLMGKIFILICNFIRGWFGINLIYTVKWMYENWIETSLVRFVIFKPIGSQIFIFNSHWFSTFKPTSSD